MNALFPSARWRHKFAPHCLPDSMPHSIAVVGLGAIAQKRHLPTIADDPAFRLVAAASLDGAAPPGVPLYRDHRAMLAAHPEIAAVIITTPPGPRHQVALDALAAGRHVLLEKPPTATLGEMEHVAGRARQAGKVLHTAWHSQYNAAIDAARARIAGRRLATLSVIWREDVEKYHPGQDWIWRPGGFGVMDAGINALSILTKLLDPPLFVAGARLRIATGAATPIAAEVRMHDGAGADMTGLFDWSWKGEDQREIHLETTDGMKLALTASGGRLSVDGAVVHDAPRQEYPDMYRHFDRLLRAGESFIDTAPLRLVADILLMGEPVAA